MKNLNLIFVIVLLFVSNQLLAQKKWIPYGGFVHGKSENSLIFPKMNGAMIGMATENSLKKESIFLDYGFELTYLKNSNKLDDGVNCINCDPPITTGHKRRYLEIAMPILLKVKILDKQRSTLNIKSGYAPTFSLPISSSYYYYTNVIEKFVEKVTYKSERKYIHTYYFGMDYRLNIKENLGLEFSPIFKYQTFKDGIKFKQFQYGLATRVVFNF